MNKLNDELEYQFPDYDADIMKTSDALAIISHVEQCYPTQALMMKKEDVFLAVLYPFVNHYMEQIPTFIKNGEPLFQAREHAFLDVTSSIKSYLSSIESNTTNQQFTTPSDFFDLDINTFISI